MTLDDYECNDNGYLLDPSKWNEEFMYLKAEEVGLTLTDEHLIYIMDARNIFNTIGTVPLIREFAKKHGMDRKAKPLYALFQTGVMKQISKLGGLPQPTGCV
jgi:dissimilatory sulfite reductase related protein